MSSDCPPVTGIKEGNNGYHLHPFRHRVPGYSHLFHVWDLLGAHAIYFGSRAFATAFMLAVQEAAVLGISYDLIVARTLLR